VPTKLDITKRELDWLSGAIGINLLVDRPGLKDLLEKLQTIERLFYVDGEAVLTEGVFGQELYLLYRGGAAVERKGKKIADLSPGDFFGEVGFLVPEVARTATVKSLGGAEVFRFDSKDFEQIISRVKGLAAVLRDTARQRMRKLNVTEK
jgi:CRP-like cAMP-binding protein